MDLAAQIESGLTTARLARTIEHLATVDSTNNRAKQRALEGAPDGLCIVADAQTAGRGRRSRRWHSPAGAGLYVSFLVRPEIPLERAPLLTLGTGVAIREALRTACEYDAAIKWPNDVLSAQGRKLAGVLVETGTEGLKLSHAVIGIGINLSDTDRPAPIRDYATHLGAEGVHVERPRVLAALANALEEAIDRLARGDEEHVLSAFAKGAAGIDQTVEFRTGDRLVRGVLVGLAPDGALELRVDGELERFYAGDLHLPGAPLQPDW